MELAGPKIAPHSVYVFYFLQFSSSNYYGAEVSNKNYTQYICKISKYVFGYVLQACTEMVMPMSSNRYSSMFPEFYYNYTEYKEGCWEDFKVTPRPTWITTEFGGHVRDLPFL